MAIEGSEKGQKPIQSRRLAKRYRIKDSVDRLSKPTPDFSYMKKYYLPDEGFHQNNPNQLSRMSKNIKANSRMSKNLKSNTVMGWLSPRFLCLAFHYSSYYFLHSLEAGSLVRWAWAVAVYSTRCCSASVFLLKFHRRRGCTWSSSPLVLQH